MTFFNLPLNCELYCTPPSSTVIKYFILLICRLNVAIKKGTLPMNGVSSYLTLCLSTQKELNVVFVYSSFVSRFLKALIFSKEFEVFRNQLSAFSPKRGGNHPRLIQSRKSQPSLSSHLTL